MRIRPQLRVRDFMVPRPVVFTPDTDLLDAARVMVERKISGAPVVDAKGTLIGVLTERDFLRAALVAEYHGEGSGHVREYMSSDVQAVSVEDTLLDVATRFVEGKHRRFPVIEGQRVVGIVTRCDVLRAVFESRR